MLFIFVSVFLYLLCSGVFVFGFAVVCLIVSCFVVFAVFGVFVLLCMCFACLCECVLFAVRFVYFVLLVGYGVVVSVAL